MGDHLTYDAVCSWLSERGLVSAISEDMVAKAMATRGEPRPLVLNRLGALDDGELQSHSQRSQDCLWPSHR